MSSRSQGSSIPPTCKEDGCSTSLLRMAPDCLQAAQDYARPLHPSAKGVRLWVSSATWSGAGNMSSTSCTLHGKPWSQHFVGADISALGLGTGAWGGLRPLCKGPVSGAGRSIWGAIGGQCVPRDFSLSASSGAAGAAALGRGGILKDCLPAPPRGSMDQEVGCSTSLWSFSLETSEGHGAMLDVAHWQIEVQGVRSATGSWNGSLWSAGLRRPNAIAQEDAH